jgi:phage terminase small subunit
LDWIDALYWKHALHWIILFTFEIRNFTMETTTRPLTAKQERFCQEYLIDFNATQAAIRAGYSKKTARPTGAENMTKHDIKARIDKRLKELALSADETTKLITDIAKSSLNKYFALKKVEFTPRVRITLKQYIKRIQDTIEFEEEYASMVNLSPDELTSHNESILYRRREIIKCNIELKRNPKATRIIDGETELTEVAELDMVALVKDKEAGRIKSVSPTEHGLKVEMYSADSALVNLARIHGLFEKDNAQSKPETVVMPLTDAQYEALRNDTNNETRSV